MGFVFVLTPVSAAREPDGKYNTDSLPSAWSYSSEFSQTLPDEDGWWKNSTTLCSIP